MARIYVIHENEGWLEPLRTAFMTRGLPFEEWFVGRGAIPLDDPPPAGVFYNRMSASSHTRGHRYAPELTSALLAWLERHGRRVVNGSRALQLEISKAAQYTALNAFGIRTPRTIAATGAEGIASAAEAFGPGPVLLKPNRGGTGHGIRLFESSRALADFATSSAFEAPIDGVVLLQEFVRSPEGCITRVEFIGGEFFYAVRVETGGSFELCPADPCAVRLPEGASGAVPRFHVTDHVPGSLLNSYRAFLAANDIEIGALEFVVNEDGIPFTYDVNTNTNYNSRAESQADRYGMDAVAHFLGSELEGLRTAA